MIELLEKKKNKLPSMSSSPCLVNSLTSSSFGDTEALLTIAQQTQNTPKITIIDTLFLCVILMLLINT